MKDTKVVSVCLITYNHEKYIRQAIEGVLMQKVNFSFELIIADDCSTDCTREIILEYKQKYPELIHLILQEKNLGPAQNWFDLITYPTGKYIAYFEGDDYWTDPLKLQKQVDFLEQNNDYVIHFMNANKVDAMSEIISPELVRHNKDTFELADFLSVDNPICTLTILFRNIKEIKEDYFKIILDYPYGDWGLWVYLLYYSGLKVKYENIISACYRVHDGGVFSKKKSTETLRKIIRIQQLNLANFDKIDKQKIHLTITELKVKLLRELLHTSKNEAFLLYVSNFYKLSKIFKIRDFLYALRKY